MAIIDLIKWSLEGFWRFIGFLTLVYVFMFFVVNGIVMLVRGNLDKRFPGPSQPPKHGPNDPSKPSNK